MKWCVKQKLLLYIKSPEVGAFSWPEISHVHFWTWVLREAGGRRLRPVWLCRPPYSHDRGEFQEQNPQSLTGALCVCAFALVSKNSSISAVLFLLHLNIYENLAEKFQIWHLRSSFERSQQTPRLVWSCNGADASLGVHMFIDKCFESTDHEGWSWTHHNTL